ncbi:MAG: RHS repeat-associated core domain-containing protein [Nitrospiria bacterium]
MTVTVSAMYGPKETVGLGEFFSGNLFQALMPPPVTLSIASGDNQSGGVNETLEPLVVQLDRLGQPIASDKDETLQSSLLIWSIISKPPGASPGFFSSAFSDSYNRQGQASTTYTLGDLEGQYSIKAFCDICNNGLGGEVFFTATAATDLALGKVFPQNAVKASVGESVGPLIVEVKDGLGNPVSGVGIRYEIIGQPTGSVAAHPASISKTTGSDGKASSTLTLGDLPGTYTVRVTCDACSAGSPLTFQAVATGPKGCSGNGVSIASQVHFASGNLFYTQNLLSLTGVGPQVGFTLAFNSLDRATGPLGPHWTHSYDMQITRDSDGFITLKEADGRRVVFSEGSPNVFVPIDHFGRPGIELHKLADGRYRLDRRDGTRYLFNASGLLMEIEDRNDNRLTLTYALGRLAALTDAAGRTTSLTYDGLGRLSSLSDPAGRVSSLGYDAAGFLNRITEASGAVTNFLYDAAGQMIQRTEPDGSQIALSYDAEGRLISATDASGIPITVAYQPESKQAILTDRDGGVTTYLYDPDLDQPIQITAPDGGITSNVYDAQGNLTSTTDPSGSITSHTYDAKGNLTSITDAQGNLTQYSYDPAFNQVTSITDPQGNLTTNLYDANGNLISTTDPSGGVTAYAYDVQGQLTSLSDPQGRTTSFVYDVAGNLIQTTDPAGAVTTMTYDAIGNLISRTDAQGQTTHFQYDANNRLIEVTDPLGNVSTFGYDARGNRTTQTDALGRTTQYVYNHLDKLTQVTDPLGGITTYTYDAKGNLTAITDAKGHTTSYAYDTKDRLMTETDPLGNTIAYSYDARDNLVSKTDAKLQTVTYQYDAQNRLTQKAYPDATTETFTYDANGRMLTAANAQIGYTFSYDGSGRTTSVTDTRGHTVQYSYDTSGSRTRLIYPDGKIVDSTYDAAGRLAALSDWQGGSTAFAYDTLGRRSSMTHFNGTQSAYAYDAAGRLTALTHRNSTGSVLDQYSYAHDPIGNRTSITRPEVNIDYAYDSLDRLTQSSATVLPGGDPAGAPTPEGYFYDAVGNRLEGPGGTDFYSYNAGNRLMSGRGSTYEYDQNGNRTHQSTQEAGAWIQPVYEYDAENRLTRIIDQRVDQFTLIDYQYDPFGRRIGKWIEEYDVATGVLAVTTFSYVYDNEDIIVREKTTVQNNVTTTETTTYLHGPGIDEPLMATSSQGTTIYHADGLGSVVALTDPTEQIVERYTYTSFGEITIENGQVDNPYTFTGREWDDESGLYFYRARYYDPKVGRFLSFDPILRGVEHTERNSCVQVVGTLSIQRPQELHPYVYVLNNPINLTDPSGKAPVYGNYCGSGNNPGQPIDQLDTACQSHDICYGKIGLAGLDAFKNPKDPKKCGAKDTCDDKLCSEAKLFSAKTFKQKIVRLAIMTIFCD